MKVYSLESKLSWAGKLLPGDFVRDCRDKVVQIKNITPERDLKGFWCRVTSSRLFPISFSIFLGEWMEKYDFFTEVYDYAITTTCGAHCSAVNCCSPV